MFQTCLAKFRHQDPDSFSSSCSPSPPPATQQRHDLQQSLLMPGQSPFDGKVLPTTSTPTPSAYRYRPPGGGRASIAFQGRYPEAKSHSPTAWPLRRQQSLLHDLGRRIRPVMHKPLRTPSPTHRTARSRPRAPCSSAHGRLLFAESRPHWRCFDTKIGEASSEWDVPRRTLILTMSADRNVEFGAALMFSSDPHPRLLPQRAIGRIPATQQPNAAACSATIQPRR